MLYLILIPFILQALVIGFDEAYFHIRRGLPLWERIGHPVDTLTVFFCLFFTLFVPYSASSLKWFIALCVFSCLMVTKDEWVHKHHCPASANWLHALLFLNHPIFLFSVGLIWRISTGISLPSWLLGMQNYSSFLHNMLVIQTVSISLFFLYQVIYWNFIWKEKQSVQ